MVGGLGESHDTGVVREDVLFGDSEFEVEHVEELAFYPADVPLAEDARAERPVHILQCGIVGVLDGDMISTGGMGSGRGTYLVRDNEGAEEDALAGPLLECDLEMGLGAVDVGKGDEEGGDLDLGLVDHVCHEGGELGMLGVPRE